MPFHTIHHNHNDANAIPMVPMPHQRRAELSDRTIDDIAQILHSRRQRTIAQRVLPSIADLRESDPPPQDASEDDEENKRPRYST